MTEQEYIDATNLAKIRATKNILRDFFPQGDMDEKDFRIAFDAMVRIEDRLTKIVRTIK